MRYHSAVDSDVIEFVRDRKSTRLNSSHGYISYAVFCLKKKKKSALKLGSLNTYAVRRSRATLTSEQSKTSKFISNPHDSQSVSNTRYHKQKTAHVSAYEHQ